MKFEWITDWETIWSAKFQSQWLDWLENSQEVNIFFHPAFSKVWIDTYKEIRDMKPLFCIATDEKNNVVFFPLVIWNKDWKSAFERVIVPLGYSDYDYSTPLIVGNNIDLNLFWSQLVDDIFAKFNHMFDTLQFTGIQQNYISENQDWILEDICPIINLKKFTSYDELLHSLKSKERGDINRQIRRLKEHEDYKFKVYKNTELEDAIKILPKILHHHTLRWPSAYKAPHYHYNLLNSLLQLNLMHLSEIRINNEGVSWNLSFMYKGTYYFYMPTHNEKYKKYSPGKVNMFLAIKDIMSKGFSSFDMLRGAENYKNKLPIIENKVFYLQLSNDNLLTKVKKAALYAKSKIK